MWSPARHAHNGNTHSLERMNSQWKEVKPGQKRSRLEAEREILKPMHDRVILLSSLYLLSFSMKIPLIFSGNSAICISLFPLIVVLGYDNALSKTSHLKEKNKVIPAWCIFEDNFILTYWTHLIHLDWNLWKKSDSKHHTWIIGPLKSIMKYSLHFTSRNQDSKIFLKIIPFF